MRRTLMAIVPGENVKILELLEERRRSKVTIYAADSGVRDVLADVPPGKGGRGGDPNGRSSRIADVCLRYRLMCDAETPELTEAEWLTLTCLFAGTILDGGHGRDVTMAMIRAMPTVLEEVDDCVFRPGATRERLAGVVRALPLVGRVAVIEALGRWWRAADRVRDGRERMLAAGMRISGCKEPGTE
jgi:hypothetical protein